MFFKVFVCLFLEQTHKTVQCEWKEMSPRPWLTTSYTLHYPTLPLTPCSPILSLGVGWLHLRGLQTVGSSGQKATACHCLNEGSLSAKVLHQEKISTLVNSLL